MKSLSLVSLLLLSLGAQAKVSFLDSVERTKWGDLEVVWVEDGKFPRFTASIYFQDGALSDPFPGLTQATFDLLSSGTSKESQREIAEFFDFYGASLRNSITHEFSVFTVQGLTKDIAPIVGKVCELFKDAQYPQNEVKSYADRSKGHLRNLITSHGALADRIFRKISLKGTPFEAPVEGTLESFEKLSPSNLKARLDDLSKTKKVLYIAGPKEIKGMKKVIAENCNWDNEKRVTKTSLRKPSPQSALYLVPVPGANQAQIRIGRYLTDEEVRGKYDQFGFLASYLGGGFTSKLVQELRVKRGLTYSAGAYVSIQRDYGRAGVMTFSKNETADDAISVIRDVFTELRKASQISPQEFKHQQGHLVGSHAFSFEATRAFLGQIMLYDHQKRSLDELAKFPERIAKLTPAELANANLEVFPWDRMTIVVVGSKELEKDLSKIRPVRILDYKDFL